MSGNGRIVMAIVIEDIQMERLAKQIATAEGISVTEVLRETLLSRAGVHGLITLEAPLRERQAALAREVDVIPARAPLDHRSDDEILGYKEHGAW
jgi:hypothetical protein